MSVVEKFYRDLTSFHIDIKDWEILDQGVTVLWGPSGAGKSTILNGLLGFDPDAHISWSFKGKDLSSLPPGQRSLGAVFQESSLFPHMTAEKNILFPVNPKKHSQWKNDFDKLVEKLQIKSILKSPVSQLSGGEKQRVEIARAMIYRPQILLLDEPFSSLDEQVRKLVRKMIKEVCREFDCPILLVTHDREDVYDLATKVTELEQGQIIKESPVTEFK